MIQSRSLTLIIKPLQILLHSIVYLTLLAFSHHASTAETWQFQGVFTQGMSLTDENNFYGDSNGSPSFEYTEISASGSFQFHSSSRISGQALYRHAGAIEDIDIDYLILDTQFYSDESALSGFRLGRYKLPYGLYNETRDVAFARQSVLLAQSLYSDSQRDLKLAADGLLLYTSVFSDYGQWDVDLSYGNLNLDNVSGYPGFPKGGTFSDESALVARVLFESFDGTYRAALSLIDAEVDYHFDLRDFDDELDQQMSDLEQFIRVAAPNAPDISIPAGGTIEEQQLIASFEYNWDKFTFSTEVKLTFTETLFPPVMIPVPVDITNPFAGITTIEQPIENLDRDGVAYYLQSKYFFNHQWAMYLRWDVVYDDKDDKSGNGAVNAPDYSMYAKDITLGGIWNINTHMMLGAEIHHIKGTQWLSTLDNLDPFATEKYWNLFVMTFSYRL